MRNASTVSIAAQRVKEDPGFDKDHWPSMADTAWGTTRSISITTAIRIGQLRAMSPSTTERYLELGLERCQIGTLMLPWVKAMRETIMRAARKAAVCSANLFAFAGAAFAQGAGGSGGGGTSGGGGGTGQTRRHRHEHDQYI